MDESIQKLPLIFDIASKFDKNIKNIFYLLSAENIVAVGGVMFLGMGIQAMATLYIMSMLSAAGITMLPHLEFSKKNKKQ